MMMAPANDNNQQQDYSQWQQPSMAISNETNEIDMSMKKHFVTAEMRGKTFCATN
jgi:hypothetical protein